MKVALYVRVSTDEQAVEGFSIRGQIDVLTEHCTSNGYEVVAIYKDEGYSAKTLNRPDLQKLLTDSKLLKFDAVMVWDVSRLSRNLSNSLKVIEELNERNISFYSYNEKNWTSTPSDKFTFQIMGAVAEFQRNQIITNVKLGMSKRAKEGKWNGGIVLGYKSVNKELILVEPEAKLVQYIFDLYINGQGFRSIANQLNKEGYSTKRGLKFAIATVKTIITNPIYAGYIRFNQVEDWEGKRRKGKNDAYILEKAKHEVIISEECWQKAQSIYERKSKKSPKVFTGHFPLTSLLRCPMCGYGMISHKTKNSNGVYIRYYQCGNSRSKGSSVCKSNLVNANNAESYVFNKLQEITSNSSLLQDVLLRVNSKIGTLQEPLENQITYIQEQLVKIETNIKKFVKFILTNDNPPMSILDEIHELEKQKADFILQKKEIEVELSKPTIKEISVQEVQTVLNQFAQILPNITPEKQKDLLHSIINKITVNIGNRPEKRSIKNIELFFDASPKDNFVLTYDTVLPD